MIVCSSAALDALRAELTVRQADYSSLNEMENRTYRTYRTYRTSYTSYRSYTSYCSWSSVIAFFSPHDQRRQPLRSVDTDFDLAPLTVALFVERDVAYAVLMA